MTHALPSLLLILLLGGLAAQDEAPPAPAVPPPILGLIIAEHGFEAGLEVTQVRPGSLAAALGVQVGDRLQYLGERQLDGPESLRQALAGLRPGDALRLGVQRGEQSLQLEGSVPQPPRPAAVREGIDDLRAAAERVERQVAERRYSLQDLLVILRQIEQDLPAAAAEFKRHYPAGRFRIAISIDISSDGAEGPQPTPTADVQAETLPAP